MTGRLKKIEIKSCQKDAKSYRFSLTFSTKNDFYFNNECVVILKNPSTTLLGEIENQEKTQTKHINYNEKQFNGFDITTQHVIKLFELDPIFKGCDGLTILNLIPLYDVKPNNIQKDISKEIDAENKSIIKEKLGNAKIALLAWGSFDALSNNASRIFDKHKNNIIEKIKECPNLRLYEVRPSVCPIDIKNIASTKPWHPQVWFFNKLND